jgi:hypothetical protein
MKNYLIIRNRTIVGQVSSDRKPGEKLAFGITVCEDTPGNREKYLNPPLTPRQIANAEFMKLPDTVRGQFAVAWVAINARLDAGDKSAALAYFDTLIIPPELIAQSVIIRNAIAAS